MKYTKTVTLHDLVQNYIDTNGHIVREEDFVDLELKYNDNTDEVHVQMNFEEPNYPEIK